MALSYVAVGPICASSPGLDGNIWIWNSTAYRSLQLPTQQRMTRHSRLLEWTDTMEETQHARKQDSSQDTILSVHVGRSGANSRRQRPRRRPEQSSRCSLKQQNQ